MKAKTKIVTVLFLSIGLSGCESINELLAKKKPEPLNQFDEVKEYGDTWEHYIHDPTDIEIWNSKVPGRQKDRHAYIWASERLLTEKSKKKPRIKPYFIQRLELIEMAKRLGIGQFSDGVCTIYESKYWQRAKEGEYPTKNVVYEQIRYSPETCMARVFVAGATAGLSKEETIRAINNSQHTRVLIESWHIEDLIERLEELAQ